jgi:HlyD family secretion protein
LNSETGQGSMDKRSTRLKRLVPAAVALGLAALALTGWYHTRQPVDTATLVLFGNIDIRQVSLAFNGSERIAEMRVQEGDRVEAGQVIARLDTRALTLQIAQAEARSAVQEQVLLRLKHGTRPEEVAQARAEVHAAQAEADLAEQHIRRLQNINENSLGAVSQQDMDNAQSRRRVALAQLENRKKALQLALIGPRQEDISQAEAQLNVARAELALLNHYLNQAELKAPINAIIRSRLLEPGDMASPDRPVYALAITDPKWVRAYVSEVDLGRIKPGMIARVTIDSHPDQPIQGRVGYISSVAEFTPKTVQTEELRTSLVYEVRIYVDDPNDHLRLGMPATVHIPLQEDKQQPGA